MELLDRIKQKCVEKSTTMGTLEKELGFGNGNIRRWETQKPSYDKILAVANALEVSLDWLVTGKEPGELTQEEQQLVDLYRLADERGKRRIRQTAELEAQEPESSSSKIG